MTRSRVSPERRIGRDVAVKGLEVVGLLSSFLRKGLTLAPAEIREAQRVTPEFAPDIDIIHLADAHFDKAVADQLLLGEECKYLRTYYWDGDKDSEYIGLNYPDGSRQVFLHRHRPGSEDVAVLEYPYVFSEKQYGINNVTGEAVSIMREYPVNASGDLFSIFYDDGVKVIVPMEEALSRDFKRFLHAAELRELGKVSTS